MNDRIPGTTWDNPIWYRGFRIYLSGEDHHGYEFYYGHDDLDGNSDDERYGYCESVDACKAEIDERFPDSPAPRSQS